jgi:SPP1 gp7 family putative phage head morphogenesis protein
LPSAKIKKHQSIASRFKELVSTFKPSLTKQIFTKNLEYDSGMEIQQENPDELIWGKGDRELRIYDMMLLDDRVSMAINLKKRLALSVPASIVPASEEQKDIDIAAEIENQLKVNGESIYTHEPGYSFWSSIDNMMDAISYGYKVAEKVWNIDQSKIHLSNLKFKHSKFYNFDYDDYANLDKLVLGKLYGTQTTIEGQKNIYDKFMVCTYPYVVDGNFYGKSELMEIYNKWRSKNHIQKQRDITLEKWGSPVPEAIYDAEKITEDELEDLEDLLDNFQEGTYFKTPAFRNMKTGELEPKIKFVIHETKSGDVGSSFDNAIDQLDKQITRSILFPDKLGFSESPGGSYNQAEKQLDLLQVVIEYTHQWIETIVNNQLIKQIVDMNFSGVSEYPKFKFNRISDKIKHEMLETLINLGVVDKREKWIRQHVGIPLITDEEQKEIDEAKEDDIKKARENMDPINPKKGDDKEDDKKSKKPTNDDINDNPQSDMRAACFKRSGNPFDSRTTKKWMDDQEDQFIVDYTRIMKDNYNAVIKQIERNKIVEEKNVKAKEKLKMPKTELKNYLTSKFSQWYFTSKKQAIGETEPRVNQKAELKKVIYNTDGITTTDGDLLHNHKYSVDETGNGATTSTNGESKAHVHDINNWTVLPAGPDSHTHEVQSVVKMKQENFRTEIDWLDKIFIDRFLGEGAFATISKEDREALKLIRDRGFTITGIEEEKMLKEINMIIDSGIRSGLTTGQVVAQIKEKAEQITSGQALTIARTNMADQYNTARLNFFTSEAVSDVIEAYQYQAIMDENTTAFCSAHDGQIIKASDPRVAQINPPNHFNCRSTLVPILLGDNEESGSFFKGYKEDTEPFGTGVPKNATQPEIGFGGSGNK